MEAEAPHSLSEYHRPHDLRYTLTVTLLLRSVGWGVSRTVYSQLSGTSVYSSAGASPWISSLPVTVK
ncbi:hypothetical protein SKAU_G00226110 [Synaphobranchus kaupii]|uniref:Uncharacterized protein n=1 Tax=Synaphobranchus kaupii TaxID=118154 RepID=A0A9Q1FBN4_SYNKA|nr:hypothetical protein SKAU_G00226110 [Synaphobranchus kaupii]